MAALFTAPVTDTSAAYFTGFSSPFYFDIPLGFFLGGGWGGRLGFEKSSREIPFQGIQQDPKDMQPFLLNSSSAYPSTMASILNLPA